MDNDINELKENFYGTHTHDFSENMLLNVADKILKADPDSGIKILERNLLEYPQSQQTYFTIARTYHIQKQFDKALIYYKKAQILRTSPWLDKTIIELKKKE